MNLTQFGRPACILLLLALASASAAAQGVPVLDAKALTLQGDFSLAGPVAYFLDDSKLEISNLAMAMDATSIHYELDTDSGSVNAFHVVATQGTTSSTPWTRSAAHLETVASNPNSQLTLIALGPATASTHGDCSSIMATNRSDALPVHANAARGPTRLPGDPVLAITGCAQEIHLHGDFQLVAWEWSLAGLDAAGNQDSIATGRAYVVNSGDPGVALESRSELHATVHNATITLRVPASPTWRLALHELALDGTGTLSFAGGQGSLLVDGRAVELASAPATARNLSGNLVPQGNLVHGTVAERILPASSTLPASTLLDGWFWWLAGAAGLAVAVPGLHRHLSRKQSVPSLRPGTRQGRPLSLAKSQFADLFAQLPE